MGSAKSVKDELHILREWHASRGYYGGVVVRDLSRPLFSLNNLLDFGHDTSAEDENTNDSIDSNDSSDDGGKVSLNDIANMLGHGKFSLLFCFNYYVPRFPKQ